MKKSPIGIAGLPGELASRNESLVAFMKSLRLSIGARVAAEQRRGIPLAEIIVQVREMVRVAEVATHPPKPTPSLALRAITRQAVAWCVATYQPVSTGL